MKKSKKKQLEEAGPMAEATVAVDPRWEQQRSLEHELRMKAMQRMIDRLDKEDLSEDDLGEIVTLTNALGFSNRY